MFEEIFNKLKKPKGQTSLEILIVMGGLVIVAVVVVTVILAASKNKVAEITNADRQNAMVIDTTLFPPNINSIRCNLKEDNTGIDISLSVIPSATKDISDYCLVINGRPTEICASSSLTELLFTTAEVGNGNFKVALVSRNSRNAISSNSVSFNCRVTLPIGGIIIPPDNNQTTPEKLPLNFTCPAGYAKVPGLAEYNTIGDKNGFCVMKWEAKMDFDNDNIGDTNVNCIRFFRSNCTYHNIWDVRTCSVPNNTKITSTSQGLPIANLTLADARNFCSNQGSGYHLITNDEWMTIVKNIEDQNVNWSGGVVNVGSLKVGNAGGSSGRITYNLANSNVSPYGPLSLGQACSTYSLLYDYNGHPAPNSVYCTTGCTENNNLTQPSKLRLSTEDEIWDFSGNLMEYVDKTLFRGHLPTPEINGEPQTNIWTEFININSTNNTYLQDKEYKPTNSNWHSAVGIGKFMINQYTQPETMIFIRGGGAFYYVNNFDASAAGIYSLYLLRTTTTAVPSGPHIDQGPGIGFRCVGPGTLN